MLLSEIPFFQSAERLGFFQVVCMNRLFPFIAEQCSTGWMDHSLFIQPPVEDLGAFLLLIIANQAAI